MATKKKLLQAAAGNAGGEALNVEDVFSTYLYEGNSSTQTITNGIDLSGEGGLVWVKGRDQARENVLQDTERGTGVWVGSNLPNGNLSNVQHVTAFNSNGFSVGTGSDVNFSGEDLVSWTFRKAPKFFTCLTYSGDGVAGRTVSHNLGSEVGCLIVKRTDTTGEWMVWHKDVAAIDASYALQLQSTNAAAGYSTSFNSTAPTSTEFTLGNNSKTNNASGTYVAYLFAHNDGDGEFGPDGDLDIIKCGSYTPDGSGNATINLGFEPQWLLIKCSSQGGTYRGWAMFDAMRGVPTGSNTSLIEANLSDAEKQWFPNPRFTPTGFETTSADQSDTVNTGGQTYIYMAIRRGTKVPESATEVFHTQLQSNGDTYSVGFPNDLLLLNKTGGSSANTYVGSRLTGDNQYLVTSSTAAEGTSSGLWSFDLQDSFDQGASTASPWVGYHWKRAPGYFDAVAYTGNGTRGHAISHNLTVAPEMIWVKSRDQADFWVVYHSALGNDTKVSLDNTGGPSGSDFVWWAKTDPTDSVFSVGEGGRVNGSGEDLIAYLFASLPGISKVGSASHSGTTNVDCGFTSGARFVLLKRTDASGDWYVWDSERGIVSGNDPYLLLNTTAAEVTNTDYIDPLSSGFTITSSFTAGTYIFYAIA